jgi:hypothetical protein
MVDCERQAARAVSDGRYLSVANQFRANTFHLDNWDSPVLPDARQHFEAINRTPPLLGSR